MRFKWCSLAIFVLMSQVLTGCYFVEYYRKVRGENESQVALDLTSDVVGESLGPKAGVRNPDSLSLVWAVNASHPPAAVRPDPDLLARRLLRQFKPESTTLARVIGTVENYRLLLGGAPADFITFPSDGYDATSVLANLKVAEQLCTALVAPYPWTQEGWSTILPFDPANKRENVTWLLQRMSGVASSSLSSASIDKLVAILDSNNSTKVVINDNYIAPCMAVLIDAQSLLL